MTEQSSAIQELLSQYCYRIEMHAPSYPASGCSRLSPEKLVRLLHEAGYHGVVLTNHFAPGNAEWVDEQLLDYAAAKREGEKYGMSVLFGTEYGCWTEEGHCLVYGVDENFLRRASVDDQIVFSELYQEFHGPDRLFIQAHPYRDDGAPFDPAYMDGMEVYNMHIGANNRINLAAAFARKHNIPIIIAGTDLHWKEQIGSSAMLTRVLPRTNAELIAILRSGDYLLEISGRPLLPFENV